MILATVVCFHYALRVGVSLEVVSLSSGALLPYAKEASAGRFFQNGLHLTPTRGSL